MTSRVGWLGRLFVVAMMLGGGAVDASTGRTFGHCVTGCGREFGACNLATKFVLEACRLDCRRRGRQSRHECTRACSVATYHLRHDGCLDERLGCRRLCRMLKTSSISDACSSDCAERALACTTDAFDAARTCKHSCPHGRRRSACLLTCAADTRSRLTTCSDAREACAPPCLDGSAMPAFVR